MIAFIGNVNMAGKVDRQASWIEKGAIEAPVFSPFKQGGAVRLEFLYASVTRIRDVEIPLLIRGHPPWHVKLSGLGASPGKTELAPGTQKVSIRIKLLDAVVSTIGHVHVSFRRSRQPSGIIKRAFFRIRFSAPASQKFTVLIKLLNDMIIGIRHVDVAIAIEGNTGR